MSIVGDGEIAKDAHLVGPGMCLETLLEASSGLVKEVARHDDGLGLGVQQHRPNLGGCDFVCGAGGDTSAEDILQAGEEFWNTHVLSFAGDGGIAKHAHLVGPSEFLEASLVAKSGVEQEAAECDFGLGLGRQRHRVDVCEHDFAFGADGDVGG